MIIDEKNKLFLFLFSEVNRLYFFYYSDHAPDVIFIQIPFDTIPFRIDTRISNKKLKCLCNCGYINDVIFYQQCIVHFGSQISHNLILQLLPGIFLRQLRRK